MNNQTVPPAPTPAPKRITHSEPPESEPAYFLKKHGLYYRPNAAGYTANVAEAGLFCKSYAESDVRSTKTEKNPDDRVTMELARGPISLCVPTEGEKTMGHLSPDEAEKMVDESCKQPTQSAQEAAAGC